MTEQRSKPRADAALLARRHRAADLERGDAVLVGNLAGVVEWTSDAWSRLTGFPLAETIDKPISHFLDRAGLELELVDFVAQNFLEGRSCTLELPFETFDGRSIHVHLEVEPLRDEHHDVSRFIAVARDASDRAPATMVRPAPSLARSRPQPDPKRTVPPTPLASLRPQDVIASTLRRHLAHDRSRWVLEALCETDLPRVRAVPESFDGLLESLLAAALVNGDCQPTFVSLIGGWLEPGRSHVSQVHPITARAIPRSTRRRVYLEVHDTSAHLPREAMARIRTGSPGLDRREQALGRAAAQAEQLGFGFFLDSTPGCGTQALILVPPSLLEAPR